MQAIHQFVAGFSNGDAISNESLALREVFRRWGHPSEIYCEPRRVLPELRATVRDVREAPAEVRDADVVLLHLSIGSVVNEVYAGMTCRKALLYHNITPPAYFSGIQPQTASNLARGLEQVAQLVGQPEVVLADSAFNAAELEGMGYRAPGVLPLVLDFDRIGTRPDRAMTRKLDDGRVNVVFVGRCVPNKKLEDCLAAFHFFQHYVEPDARFVHAGSFAGAERYHALLLALGREWQTQNVLWLGAVRQAELSAVYRTGHVFLCMSEHEGFCIPLVEAMAHDLPVLAYAAAAVPETLDGAGVLFREKRFDLVAEMTGRLVRDRALRAAVLDGQRARLARFRSRDLEAELRGHLAPVLD